MIKRLGAEFIGTFWLVLGGCGSAVLAAKFGGDGNPLGIGLLGVSLAFGLTVLTGAYALGHISGGHFNPAVSFGLWAGGRFPARDLRPYIVSQTLGAVFAAWILFQIASGAAKTTHELRAVAIERALSASDGDLFTPKVLRGAGTTQQRTA